jgi:hypothetical protein
MEVYNEIMEIIIEIDNDIIKQLIREELEFFVGCLGEWEPKLKISRIVVPLDFEGKVSELTGDINYSMYRGKEGSQVSAMAKAIEENGYTTILLSPVLYIVPELYDVMVRHFIFFHEIGHVINKQYFPPLSKDSSSKNNYLANLYFLYDEYYSDRFSYSLLESVFDMPTETWRRYTNDLGFGYLETASDPQYYDEMSKEIKEFREHRNVDLFMEKVLPTIHVISVTTIHAFSRFHQENRAPDYSEILHTPFVNSKTLALMEYFKNKFLSNNVDLSDGVSLARDYFENFGVRFEDRELGLWIQVLDI